MKHNRLIAAAAISASVLGGAAGGALLFTPGTSGAKDVTTVAAEGSSSATAQAARPGPGLRGDLLPTAAKALGISEADLKAALQGGKSIADVAKDQGVDVDKVIDALVAEAQTDLEDRITAMVNGEAPLGGEGHGPGGRDGFRGAVQAGLDTVADALGLSEDDLRAELRDGKSIADIAKDKGVSVDSLVTKLVDAAGKKIDQAVTDGKLTQDQATKLKDGLQDAVTAMVNGTRPEGRGPGGFGGRGFRGGAGGQAPQAETGSAGGTTS
jgi:hypothetical protein